ncbi:MAG: hypothetical protein ACK559_12500, partial [bacterium]
DEALHPLEVALQQRDADEVHRALQRRAQPVEAVHRALLPGDVHLHVGQHDLDAEAAQPGDHVQDALGQLPIIVREIAVHQGVEEERPGRGPGGERTFWGRQRRQAGQGRGEGGLDAVGGQAAQRGRVEAPGADLDAAHRAGGADPAEGAAQ